MKPAWLKVAARTTERFAKTRELLSRHGLRTVCAESACPNIWECWDRSEPTFLIMGGVCARACRFCRVESGRPAPLDPDEPARIALSVAELNSRHIVVTSVTRDDLPDGGAAHFAAVTRAVRTTAPECSIELLIPDFGGNRDCLDIVMAAAPDVIGHNIETVPRLYPDVRPEADYRRSLGVIAHLAGGPTKATVKSGLMVGMGETRAELRYVFRELREAGADSITIGQYMPPSPAHFPVARYWRPEEFIGLAVGARRLGFSRVLAGPLVRSSYRAAPVHGRALEDG